MARRLIVCMDGTNNEVGDRQTHVVRIYRGLRRTKDQIPYYVQGVGTMDGQTLSRDTQAKRETLRGLAFGKGLEDDVLEAYRFLSNHYDFERYEAYQRDKDNRPDKDDGRDQICLVGFSRGAYAARVLAGFIHDFGLLRPESVHMAAQAFRAYRLLSDADPDVDDAVKYATLRRYTEVFKPISPPISGMVLFDTVASMIRMRRVLHNLRTQQSPIELSTHRSTSINQSVRFVIHAMALDEKRSFFRPLPWKGDVYKGHRYSSKEVPQIVRQVWFPGYHGDIGGSAREDRSGIGKITLAWAMDQLSDIGENWTWVSGFKANDVLGQGKGRKRFSVDGHEKPGPDYGGHIHNSMSLAWLPLEFLPKTIKRRQFKAGRRGLVWYLPRSEPRFVPKGASVHPSAFDRREDGRRCYNPLNLAQLTRDQMDPDDPSLLNPSYTSKSARGGDR